MALLSLRFLPVLFAASLFNVTAQAGWQDLLKEAGTLLQNGASPTQSNNQSNHLSNIDIDAGLKEALRIGAERAVALLGKEGGFLNDQLVRIPLPDSVQMIAEGLRAIGQGSYVDEFEQTVNRAAEKAIPQTLGIVQQTVEGMQLEDVVRILQGKSSAATDFLRERAGQQLHQIIKPLVADATQQAGVTAAYKNLIGQTQGNLFGLGNLLGTTQSVDLDEYVTGKTLDGLFLKLAAEEKAIRENPVARTTELLEKVFTH